VTRDQTVLLALGGLALVCVLLVVAVVRLRREVRASSAEAADLRARLARLEAQRATADAVTAAPVRPAVEYVITDLGRPGPSGEPEPEPEPVHLDAPAFADIVLKETVVKAASLAHGLRRGLAPATRNRIRFEMKQEVRRSRKQRRADLKAAQRDLHARQRAALSEEAAS
jgi:hypothetical protein